MKRRFFLALMVAGALIIGTIGAGTAAGVKKGATDGCTPGYWKQEQHFDSWVSYTPSQLFNTVFGVDAFPPGTTLLQVLGQGGGGLNALGRHAVAALLNASSGIYFYWSPTEVTNAFDLAYPGSKYDYEGLKDAFEFQNMKGCPLN